MVFRPGRHVGKTRDRRGTAERLRRPRALRRRRMAARPRTAAARAVRHPLCHGIPGAAEQARRRRRRGSGGRNGTISAKGKHVVVIGGGDTGSDCIGTSNRQGAASVTQLEIMPEPPERENKALTWPNWPLKLRTSSSQDEGCERDFAVATRRAIGWTAGSPRWSARAWNGRAATMAGCGWPRFPAANSRSRPTSCFWPWASWARTTRACSKRPRSNSTARQRRGQHRRLPDLEARRLRLRRHAPRPIPGRVGDPRGPPVRPRGGRSADGNERPAEVSYSISSTNGRQSRGMAWTQRRSRVASLPS